MNEITDASIYAIDVLNVVISISCINQLFLCFPSIVSNDSVNSHPIIEDCGSLRFAPYLIEYKALAEDFKTSGLEKASSWVCHQNFIANHLRTH